MGNNALTANPPNSDETIGQHASDWYFAICAAMAFSGIVFSAMMFRQPRTQRVFHYITILIVFVASIAYFTMGSNLGSVPVQVEFQRDSVTNGTRQFFYARYIDWVITTPLLLMDLLLTAALPWPTILWTILVDEIMIVTGLVGALVVSSYKWGYWVFGMIAFFLVVWNIVFVARKNAVLVGSDVSRLYMIIAGLTVLLWTLYPVAWGLAEGGNYISSDSEAYFYGVLDFFAKPVFGFVLLFGHRNIDPARLGLRTRDYGDVTNVNGEKHTGLGHNGVHHNGATNGAMGTTGTTTSVV